jgi:hypothetical protein
MAYIRGFLARLAILLSLYVGSIVVVDPYHARSLGWFPTVLSDDRPEKSGELRQFIREGPVEGLVLGSSRALTLNPKVLRQVSSLRYFNFAFNAATIPQIAEAFGSIRREGVRPKEIVIALDPNHLMGRRRPERRAQAIAQGSIIARAQQTVIDLRTFFSPTLAEDSLRSIGIALHLVHQNITSRFDGDGGLLPEAPQAAGQAVNDRQSAMANCVAAYHGEFSRYDTVSEFRLGELEELLRTAAADGAVVTLLVTPLNPAVETEMVKDTAYMELSGQALSRVRVMAARYHFQVQSTSDLTDLTRAEDWSDCVHFRSTIADAIVPRLVHSPRNN